MATILDSDKNEERRKRVFVGKLPPDFLRITSTNAPSRLQQQEAADAQAAMALQQQLGLPYSQKIVGRLSITVAEAKLVKNYGMTRMDPYASLRVGHSVHETRTDVSGGKNPKWNQVMEFLLPQGVNTIHLNIYDDCSLKMDELIAWTEIQIPQNVLDGDTCDDWFPLSGKQGERVEGMINLVISFVPGTYGSLPIPLTSMIMGLTGRHPYGATNPQKVSVTVDPNPLPVDAVRPPYAANQYNTAPFQLSLEDLKQVEEMFPNMDKDVVKSVYEANGGNKDLTINSLLQMSA